MKLEIKNNQSILYISKKLIKHFYPILQFKMPIKKTDNASEQADSATSNKTKRTRKQPEAQDELMEQVQDFSKKAEWKLQNTASKVEKSMDKLAGKIKRKAKTVVTAEFEQKAESIAEKVDEVAGSVEGLVKSFGNFVPDPNKVHSHSGIKVQADFREEVSRLFIFRFLWLIVQIPVMYIWSIWIAVVYVLQTLYMLIMGKRSKILREKIYRYLSHTTKRNAYIAGFIDEEPKILEDMPQ